jgi:tRNA(Ile)-lysidine synthase
LDIRHNGDVEIHNGWVLHWEMTHQPPREYESGGLSVWLDADQIEPPLKLTCRMEGDRFSPLGMNGETITVSDAFTNRKLPKQARSAWPILRDNRKILWIAGYQPCDQAKITPGSRNILHVVLQKKIH